MRGRTRRFLTARGPVKAMRMRPVWAIWFGVWREKSGAWL